MAHGERAARLSNRMKEFWGVDYRGSTVNLVTWIPRKLVRVVSRARRRREDRQLMKEREDQP